MAHGLTMADVRPERKRVKRGRACKFCMHPERGRIEVELACGRSLASLTAQFGLSQMSLRWHWKHHVTEARKTEILCGPAYIRGVAKRAAEEEQSILEYLSIVRSTLVHRLLECSEQKNYMYVSMLSRQLVACIDSIARVTGQLRAAGITINNLNTINTVNAPQSAIDDAWIARMFAAIIRSLAPFPEAREAAAKAMREFSAQEKAKSNGHLPLLIEAQPVKADV